MTSISTVPFTPPSTGLGPISSDQLSNNIGNIIAQNADFPIVDNIRNTLAEVKNRGWGDKSFKSFFRNLEQGFELNRGNYDLFAKRINNIIERQVPSASEKSKLQNIVSAIAELKNNAQATQQETALLDKVAFSGLSISQGAKLLNGDFQTTLAPAGQQNYGMIVSLEGNKLAVDGIFFKGGSEGGGLNGFLKDHYYGNQ